MELPEFNFKATVTRTVDDIIELKVLAENELIANEIAEDVLYDFPDEVNGAMVPYCRINQREQKEHNIIKLELIGKPIVTGKQIGRAHV